MSGCIDMNDNAFHSLKRKLSTFLGKCGYYRTFIAGDLRTRESKIARRGNLFGKELILHPFCKLLK